MKTLLSVLVAAVLVVGVSAAGQEKKDPDKDRVIKVGDALAIGVDDLKGPGITTTVKQVVDAKGNVNLPYVGNVAAKGLTPVQLERAILKAYRDARLIESATVSVKFAPAEKDGK